ncbi:hypothetical protein P389DRAFT_192266 [Cystobasidium minutum MCA 4210]|uniref:uncharacterized protein n=1 Tax=Cystobasidium minutum MCA 4210 TaxID=1397322 RepID=UPI0034CDB62A|eukprot:jgi/Rhomi1/192266/gm1.480_g
MNAAGSGTPGSLSSCYLCSFGGAEKSLEQALQTYASHLGIGDHKSMTAPAHVYCRKSGTCANHAIAEKEKVLTVFDEIRNEWMQHLRKSEAGSEVAGFAVDKIIDVWRHALKALLQFIWSLHCWNVGRTPGLQPRGRLVNVVGQYRTALDSHHHDPGHTDRGKMGPTCWFCLRMEEYVAISVRALLQPEILQLQRGIVGSITEKRKLAAPVDTLLKLGQKDLYDKIKARVKTVYEPIHITATNIWGSQKITTGPNYLRLAQLALTSVLTNVFVNHLCQDIDFNLIYSVCNPDEAIIQKTDSADDVIDKLYARAHSEWLHPDKWAAFGVQRAQVQAENRGRSGRGGRATLSLSSRGRSTGSSSGSGRGRGSGTGQGTDTRGRRSGGLGHPGRPVIDDRTMT